MGVSLFSRPVLGNRLTSSTKAVNKLKRKLSYTRKRESNLSKVKATRGTFKGLLVKYPDTERHISFEGIFVNFYKGQSRLRLFFPVTV